MENPIGKYGKSTTYKWKIGTVEMKNQLPKRWKIRSVKIKNPFGRNEKCAL
jgi:hypothetical protein